MIDWIVTVLLGFLIWVLLENKNRKNMPPGPIKLPLVGNTLQIKLADKSAGQAYYKLAKKYGDLMSLQDGSGDSVVLSSAELVRDLFSRDELTDRHGGEGGLDRNMNRNMGIVFSSGQVWKDLRRFTIRTLRDFGFGKSFSMEMALEEELHHFVRHLKTVAQCSPEGKVNFEGIFKLTTLNIVWKLIIGERFDYEDPKIINYMQLNEEFFRSQSFVSGWSLVFPFLRKMFPDRTGRTAILKSIQVLQDFLRTLIQQSRKSENYKNDPQTFLDVFLAKITSESTKPETVFTEDQLLITMLDIFQAGSETTSSTLSFAILYLIMNPIVQIKLQAEIDNVIAESSGNGILISHRAKMIYTQATILEVHRRGLVIPIPIAHKVTREFNYKGFIFKKGTPVFSNVYAIFMNEEFWGDPENFRPERFITTKGLIDKKKAEQVIPFAIGKRVCPGEAVAESTIFMYLTTLLQHFSFELVPGEPKPTLVPQEGFASAPKPFSAIIKVRK